MAPPVKDAAHVATARTLLDDFAARTGLVDGDAPSRRYLWTDAFAVCTWLRLATQPDGAAAHSHAARLVHAVHHVLGRHRPEDVRSGWLSGMDAATGEAHPTAGGLRIGKPLPERGPVEPVDPRLEWERDGQYFHYLTRWMHALDQFAWQGGPPEAGRWARELAQVAARAFLSEGPGGRTRMAWKMSVGLDRPLVDTMGQHDPLDGLVTCLQLQAHRDGQPPDLSRQVDAFLPLAAAGRWETDDPLGIGGLLVDAVRMAQLPADPDGTWVAALLHASRVGLEAWHAQRPLAASAERRLAFRELGLSIGLHGLDLLASRPVAAAPACAEALAALRPFAPIADEIDAFWLVPDHRQASAWRDHEDINAVMLATSLVPDGYLRLRPG